MPAAGMGEIIRPAQAAGRGVGAFNVIGIEHAEAIVAGAEAAAPPWSCRSARTAPPTTARWSRSRGPACRSRARPPCRLRCTWTTPPGRTWCTPRPGWALRSVMYDASALPYGRNVEATAALTRWCHDRGLWVEAELGEIGGKNGVHSPLARTRPDEAAAYVAATGVDALAVAVGSSHAMLTRDAALDLGLIAGIHDAVSVPLVLHGSSGVPDAAWPRRYARE